MSGRVGECPREHNWSEGLEDLKEEVHSQELLSVLITSGKSVQSAGGSDGEYSDTKQDWHLSSGLRGDVGSNDIGDDTDGTGDHVVEDRLELIKPESSKDESWKEQQSAVGQGEISVGGYSRPKALIPPETNDTQKTMRANAHCLGSKRHSLT